jgi:hypothetical protein
LMTSSIPYLSIIFPAHNEEETPARNIGKGV